MAFGLWATRAIGPGADDDGIELPPVTAEDNGKLVGVTEGKYGLVDAPSGGGVVWVQLGQDGDTPTSDKTFADIVEALENGLMVVGTDEYHNLYYLSNCAVETGANFVSIPYVGVEGVGQEYYTVTADGVTDGESYYPQNSDSQ